MKTRAELIVTLTELQVKRIWGEDYPLGDEYLKKKYWGYHDYNCKKLTRDIKNRISQELIWKVWNI